MGKCRLTRVPINFVGKKSEEWGFSLEGGWATRHGTELGSPQGPVGEHRARLRASFLEGCVRSSQPLPEQPGAVPTPRPRGLETGSRAFVMGRATHPACGVSPICSLWIRKAIQVLGVAVTKHGAQTPQKHQPPPEVHRERGPASLPPRRSEPGGTTAQAQAGPAGTSLGDPVPILTLCSHITGF